LCCILKKYEQPQYLIFLNYLSETRFIKIYKKELTTIGEETYFQATEKGENLLFYLNEKFDLPKVYEIANQYLQSVVRSKFKPFQSP
jgi:DNA-binding PadR family transcriptional regulator